METHRKTLLHLLKERAYKHGKFTLSSGKESEHYINCKPVTLSCEGNALCSHLMIEHVEDEYVAVGGLTLGADPLVCGIAQKAYYSGKHIDALIVRKNPKGYGTKEVIEGNKPPKGSVVTVLEDVANIPIIGWVAAGWVTMFSGNQGAEIGGNMAEDLNKNC